MRSHVEPVVLHDKGVLCVLVLRFLAFALARRVALARHVRTGAVGFNKESKETTAAEDMGGSNAAEREDTSLPRGPNVWP